MGLGYTGQDPFFYQVLSPSMNLPPHLNSNDKLVLFDGVCKLCNAWCQFLLKCDKEAIFKLCSVQSPEGQDILKWFDLPTDSYASMIYVEEGCAYVKSAAFIRIIAKLPNPWRQLRHIGILPKRLRDWCYDRIALNRYTLFGRYQSCALPSAEHQHRFLRARQGP